MHPILHRIQTLYAASMLLLLTYAGAASATASQDDKGSKNLTAAEAPSASSEVSRNLRALPVISSKNGVLRTTLVASRMPVSVADVTFDGLVFNGDYAGPLLRVSPGDRLNIRLVNRTDLPINIHWHGSHASPLGASDNVHIVVSPGASFTYKLSIPATQPTGLYWYHSHIHGLSEEEVSRGLSGAMIVEGLQKKVPEASDLPERVMVLKTINVDEDSYANAKALHGVIQSINGSGHSDVYAVSGAAELWRISNQSPNDYYHLSAKGFHFRIVAFDGAPTRSDLAAESLDIPPAGRVEAIVTLPSAGDYPLLSGSTPTGVGRALKLSRELALIHVRGDRLPLSGSTPLAERQPPARDLRNDKITMSRVVTFSQKPGEEIYYINGNVYDHHRIDIRLPLGSVEEWTIRNDTDDMHVFHIHQVHFQVVAINGEPQAFDRILDTVRIPERGSVTLRIDFTDPQIVGKFMYHCHVLKHEDKGMMANIEVYDPNASSESSGNHSEDHPMHGQP